jgi:hypothetical protein
MYFFRTDCWKIAVVTVKSQNNEKQHLQVNKRYNDTLREGASRSKELLVKTPTAAVSADR